MDIRLSLELENLLLFRLYKLHLFEYSFSLLHAS